MASGEDRAEDGRATRWAGHRERRRAELVTAALAAIGEHGPGVSTELIAQRAGIPRPRLYRIFTDADDLHDAIAHRVADSLMDQLTPTLTRPSGTPNEIITRIVDVFVTWMTDNVSLYHYLVLRATAPGEPVIVDVRSRISRLLADLLRGYLIVLGLDPSGSDPLSWGLVGMVESTTERWLVAPGTLGRDGLVDQLSIWIWGLLDHMLRASGVILAPDVPLPPFPEPEHTA